MAKEKYSDGPKAVITFILQSFINGTRRAYLSKHGRKAFKHRISYGDSASDSIRKINDLESGIGCT